MGSKLKRRKSTSAAVYVPVAALIIIFLTMFGTSIFFKISAIEIKTNTAGSAARYSDEQILKASGIRVGENIVLVSTLDAKKGILKALPYIRDVSITRDMPDRIVIEANYSSEIATVEWQGGVAVIDSDGKVLDHVDKAPDNLIKIIGLNPVGAREGDVLTVEYSGLTRLTSMIEVLKTIEGAEMNDKVSYLDVTNISKISFGYLARFNVLLGVSEGVKNKVNYLPEEISKVEAKGQDDSPGTLNMSIKPWRWEPAR